jgi:hypothetical protein
VIYVVANEAFGNVDDLAVHHDSLSSFAAAGARAAKCVRRVPVVAQSPFVFCQPTVIIDVYDGVFALAHGY